jgi:2-oxo-4-hydroxy-4-carboxy--5-ureidoimidazoline (OHCU) decarboxylase
MGDALSDRLVVIGTQGVFLGGRAAARQVIDLRTAGFVMRETFKVENQRSKFKLAVFDLKRRKQANELLERLQGQADAAEREYVEYVLQYCPELADQIPQHLLESTASSKTQHARVTD